MKKITTLLFGIVAFSFTSIGQTTVEHAKSIQLLHHLNAFDELPSDTEIFSNLLPCDSLVFSYGLDKKNPIDSGWMEGNNYKLTKATAEYFRFGDAGICTELLGIGVQLSHVHFAKATDAVTFYAWKNDGPNGAPGTVLASTSVKLNTLDTTKMDVIYFSSAVMHPGNVYIGYSSATYKNNKFSFKPSIACYQSGIGLMQGEDDHCIHDSAEGTAWTEDASGNWLNYKNYWNAYASNTIYAVTSPEPACGPLIITPPTASICKGKSVSLTASGGGITYFAWSPSTGLNATTGATVTASPAVTTTYTCKGNDGCCMALVTVTVLNAPIITATQAACSGQAVLLTAKASSGSDPLKYQWKLSNANISGATKSTYSATTSGNYKCQVTDKTTTCKTTSNQLVVTINCRQEVGASDFNVNVYPNPFSQSFNMTISSPSSEPATVEVLDLTGRTIRSYENVAVNIPFKIQNLSEGIFFVQINQEGNTKIIKAVGESPGN